MNFDKTIKAIRDNTNAQGAALQQHASRTEAIYNNLDKQLNDIIQLQMRLLEATPGADTTPLDQNSTNKVKTSAGQQPADVPCSITGKNYITTCHDIEGLEYLVLSGMQMYPELMGVGHDKHENLFFSQPVLVEPSDIVRRADSLYLLNYPKYMEMFGSNGNYFLDEMPFDEFITPDISGNSFILHYDLDVADTKTCLRITFGVNFTPYIAAQRVINDIGIYLGLLNWAASGKLLIHNFLLDYHNFRPFSYQVDDGFVHMDGILYARFISNTKISKETARIISYYLDMLKSASTVNYTAKICGIDACKAKVPTLADVSYIEQILTNKIISPKVHFRRITSMDKKDLMEDNGYEFQYAGEIRGISVPHGFAYDMPYKIHVEHGCFNKDGYTRNIDFSHSFQDSSVYIKRYADIIAYRAAYDCYVADGYSHKWINADRIPYTISIVNAFFSSNEGLGTIQFKL